MTEVVQNGLGEADEAGISPIKVYSDGPLDQGRSRYPIGRLFAFLFFGAFMVAPAAIAYQAGAEDPDLLDVLLNGPKEDGSTSGDPDL
eukprot:COSAG02_NODE_4593_length_5182_cov_62.861275_2_plen_87_part_01